MSQYVREKDYPNSAVLYIEAYWGEQTFFGSGFLAGVNDIITASHVIYNEQLGGLADEIRVFPLYNPSSQDNFSVKPVHYHYFSNFDENADGMIPTGDLTWWSYAGSELDIALLTLDIPLGSIFGWYGLDFGYSGGAVSVLGYPGTYGRRQVIDEGIAQLSNIDGVFYLDRGTLDINPGNSGGPIFYDTIDGPLAVGVVSTSVGATNISSHSAWLLSAIESNNDYLNGQAIVEGRSIPDVLIDGDESNFILGFQGDDQISGGGGNDILVGGDGLDIALFTGSISSYTMKLSADYCEITDRRPFSDGTDQLISIEKISFSDFYFDLEKMNRVIDLDQNKISDLSELYIAYFNRAPDALGLSFWGTSYSNGLEIRDIANLFGSSEEAQRVYPTSVPAQEFVESIYNNVLGRLPDEEGLSFWVDVLDDGTVTKEQLIFYVLSGVPEWSADRDYLDQKVDIGTYFSIVKGMSDRGAAAAVMQLYDGTEASLQKAITAIDIAYAGALDPNNGQFLLQLNGIVENPFIM